MQSYTEVTVADGIAEYFFHLTVPGYEPVRMYRWADEMAECAKDLEYLDDDDEHDLHDPKSYREGTNPLFAHVRSPSTVRRLWAYLEPCVDELEEFEGRGYNEKTQTNTTV